MGLRLVAWNSMEESKNQRPLLGGKAYVKKKKKKKR